MKRPKNLGGWGFCDLYTFALSTQLSLLINTFRFSQHPLKTLYGYFLGDVAIDLFDYNSNLKHNKLVSCVNKWKEVLPKIRSLLPNLTSRIRPAQIYTFISENEDLPEMGNFNWKRIHDPSLSPELQESNWRYAVGAYATKAFLFKIKRIQHSKCTLCNGEETYFHIVTECSMAKFQWQWVGALFKCYVTEDNILRHTNYKTCNTYLFNCVLSIVKRHIWKARCAILYDRKRITPGLLKTRVVETIRRKIQADIKALTPSQFEKLYQNTKGVVWNENADSIEILHN